MHGQPPGAGWADGDHHIRLTPCQIDDAGQGEDLDLKLRVGLANRCADLRQQEIRRPVRCPDADLAGQSRRRPGQLFCGVLHRLFSANGWRHQPLTCIRQRVAVLRFRKKRGPVCGLQAGNPPPYRGGIHAQVLPGPREGLGTGHGQKDFQIIPLRVHEWPRMWSCKIA